MENHETPSLNHARSAALFDEARGLMPGGVNSPVRAFKGVGGTPVFVREGHGCRMTDVDGNEYIDYVGSWGPLIMGHAHPKVVEALKAAVEKGTSFGCPTEAENELARLVIDAVPSIEMVRMVNSGTEGVMSAVRVARGFTGRPRIIKMAGCYHGHGDSLLVRAGSGVATLGLPDSPGVTPGVAADTLTVPYNDVAAVREVLEQEGDRVAAVLVEPVAGNMGVVPPAPGYLQALRDLTRQYGIVLIFDEVMSGFRVALGGAQALYGVTPDLTVLGKVIGGGLPVAAYGGRRDIMEQVAPAGPVYQAGTLSGNPLAMAAGLATLRLIKEEGVYEALEAKSAQLAEGLGAAAREAGVPVYQTRVGSMQCLFFQEGPVTDYESARLSDTVRYGKYFHAMLEGGVYLAPSQFEAAFVGAAHGEADIDRTVEAARKVFKSLV